MFNPKSTFVETLLILAVIEPWWLDTKLEPLTTASASNLAFTLESKFVIVSAFTWDEPLITPSPFISKYLLSKSVCNWDEPLTTVSEFSLVFTRASVYISLCLLISLM